MRSAERETQLDRIERKLDRLLFILGDGRKDIHAEAKRIIDQYRLKQARDKEPKTNP